MAEGGYSQVHSLTFVDEVGLEYGGDTQGIGDYIYDEFTLPSQTQGETLARELASYPIQASQNINFTSFWPQKGGTLWMR